jgi:hypothetical protein
MSMDFDRELEKLAGEILVAYNHAARLRQKDTAELLLEALEELAGEASCCEDTLLDAYARALPRMKTANGQ